MDVKSYRSRNTLRVFGDENANPQLASDNKALIARHKSSPALHSLAKFGTNRTTTGPKRAAFGEITNVANNRLVRDDSAVTAKAGLEQILKPATFAEPEKRQIKPAQRPLSVAGLRGLVNTVLNVARTSPPNNVSTQIKPSQERQPSVSDANNRPATAKSIDILTLAASHPIPQSPAISPTECPVLPEIETLQSFIPEDLPLSRSQPALVEVSEQVSVPLKEEHQAQNAIVPHHRSSTFEDVEEYWEEEEDDGYTTGRSYRSKGENLTSGATTMVMPRTNLQIRRELAAAKELVESARTAEDLEDDMWDTSLVAEYGDDIFEYMRELETRMQPNPHYMDRQTEIKWGMRSVLIDWLVQVHHRFQLLPETLFLTVNYVDRFLSCKVVSLAKLQLVGATALFVAAKYEEINCPSIQEIIYMVDDGYSAEEILKAERYMLNMLQFELGFPGPMSFLRRISKADEYDLETRTLAKYFLELTVMDERFLPCPPSFTAAGAHCLARLILRKGHWTPAHVYYSEYTYTQLHPLVRLITECCLDPQRHHKSIYDKYTDKRFKRASLYVAEEIRKGFTLPELPTTRTSYRASYAKQQPRSSGLSANYLLK